MRTGSATLTLLLLAAAHCAAAAQPAAPRPADARLDRIVTGAMRHQRIPAAAVAVMTGGRIVYSQAFGTADLENSVPATRHTLFRTASIAKTFTAVAAMTLVEAGRLDLDAPVQRYCAPFPEKQWPITARELLSHTSGIRHYNPGEPEYTHHYQHLADAFALFAGDPLLFRPGTAYAYSTYAYTVAGCAIEGASGERFTDYVAAHVLAPAAMTHTFVDDSLGIVPHRARGYQLLDGEVKNSVLMDSSYKIPGGGYVTSAEDLVRFAQALLAGKLVRPASLREMWTATAVSGARDPYGLGFALPEGGRFVMHTGGQSGTSTELFIIPETRAAIAVLTNLEHADLRALVRAIALELHQPALAPAAR
ncbi:MAG TPA: serine hydrolase domain-containing protein [Steroidobacteraceae bacterium]|nr:beta-lactamase family protein [Gammaproteobacteria bacterium]HEV2287183.1 serine hydrolase domain-containing protein [Steroidobacteraceae bacterium]